MWGEAVWNSGNKDERDFILCEDACNKTRDIVIYVLFRKAEPINPCEEPAPMLG